uniref:Sugar transferase n=1 Tax=candidate division WOR-3 bacterium TaxID=2052148 RepID=A0A7C4TH17_UNCW3
MRFLFLKRPFDIVLSFTGIIVSLPLWFLIGVMILIEDGFPIFYSQERMGKNRRIFKVFKFRSMVKDADRNGPVWTYENDTRITKVGRILRKTAFDELPSLLSILKGDMSFVGPRALAIEEQRFLEQKISGFEKRLSVHPGLTGLAQVYNLFDDPYKKIELDLEYINNMSLLLDIKLIILSFFNTFTARWDKRKGKHNERRDRQVFYFYSR